MIWFFIMWPPPQQSRDHGLLLACTASKNGQPRRQSFNKHVIVSDKKDDGM